MARSFLTAINLNKNELQNAAVQNLGTAPNAPAKGQLYFDSVGNILYWWNGTVWVAAMSGASLSPASTVTTEAIGDTGVVGTSSNYAREDHKHGMPAFGPVTGETVMGSVKSDGTAFTVARSDHQHGNPSTSGVPPTGLTQIGATAYQGSNNQPSRGDHVHAWGIPLANLDMGGFLVTNTGTPVSGTDATNKTYVDSLVTGLSWKQAVRAASTAAIGMSGPQTVDGVACVVGNRVLVKNQTGPNGALNGIYVVNAGSWTRALDANSSAELAGAAVFVMEGATQADTGWVCTDDASFVLDTDNNHWAQFSGSGSVVAGAGMTQVGTVLNVVSGDASLVVNPDEMHVGYGGTGSAGTAARSDHNHVGTYVQVAGDTMTGQLTINKTGVNISALGSVQAQTFAAIGNGGGLSATSGGYVNLSGSGAALTVAGTGSQVDFTNVAQQVTLPAITPTLANHAATKAYVDGKGVADGDKGDITVSGGGTVYTIDNSAVTNAKLADAPGNSIKGNKNLGAGPVGDLSMIDLQNMSALYMGRYKGFAVGGSVAQTLTHNLGTGVMVQVIRNSAPGDTVECDVERPTNNTVTLRFAVAPAANEYYAIVVG